MKINGEIVRKIRKRLGMTQAEFAEKLDVSEKTISRIENNNYKSGEYGLSISKFAKMLELAGIPDSEFWLLYLTTEEYEGYKTYKKVQRFFDQDRMEESVLLLEELEKNPITENPIVKQSIEHMKIVVETTFNDTPVAEIDHVGVLRKLYKLLGVSYLQEARLLSEPLTQTEIKILNHIGIILYWKGEQARAMRLYESLYKARDRFQFSEEDDNKILPVIMVNLATYLMRNGKYNESLELATSALKFCKDSEELWSLPTVLRLTATLSKEMGKPIEEYKPTVLQAYYSAKAIGRELLAKGIYDEFSDLFV